jgi:adenylate cyclase
MLLVWCFGMLVAGFLSRTSIDVEGFAEAFRQRFGQAREPDPQIVLVGLDDEVFLQEQFHRANHATVIENLTRAKARLIFFDVVFDEDREARVDFLLRQALLQGPPVVLAGSSLTLEDGTVLPPKLASSLQPALDLGSSHLASIEKAEDEDGVLRKYFLAVGFGEQIVPSVALACYSLLQSVKPQDIQYQESSIDIPPVSIPIQAHHSEGTKVTVFAFDLKFHPPATGPNHKPGAGTYRVIPYLDLLAPSPELLDSLAGKVVVIGENTTSDNDIVTTPVGAMKGFEAHAQCLDRLIHHDFYTAVSDQANLQVTAVLIALVAMLGLLRWPLSGMLALGLAILGGYAAINLWLFQEKYIILRLAAPLLGAASTLACLVLVRVLFASRFLARFIPVEATRGILMAKETAQATTATVIVTDIRGYTTLSETRTPVEMLKLLNEYHSVTVDIYHQYGGNVLTFQGDAQLVVFGYPRKLKDPVGAAVESSMKVMEAIDCLRTKWGIAERKNFDVGAGICTGLVYVGDIGSREQANYTVIGEVVRTSHKVQSMSDVLQGNVLMDEPSYQACRAKMNVTAIPDVMLEGFPDPKTLYRVEPDPPKPPTLES